MTTHTGKDFDGNDGKIARLEPVELPPAPEQSESKAAEPTETERAIERLRGLLMPIGSDVLDNAPPDREWLIDRVLPLGKVGILAAGGGVGKTRALIELGIAVAAATTWFGLGTRNPGRVLLALGEEDAGEVHRRIYHSVHDRKDLGATDRAAIANRLVALPLAGVPSALVANEGGKLRETETLEALRAILNDGGERWSLIVLDPLSRFAGTETETDNAQATRFIQAVESLALQTGATVLMAHHTTKTSRENGATGATGIRGASGLHDGARWAATLDPWGDCDLVTLSFVKSNYSKKAEPIHLLMGEHGVLRPASSEEIEKARAEREERKQARETAAKPKGQAKPQSKPTEGNEFSS